MADGYHLSRRTYLQTAALSLAACALPNAASASSALYSCGKRLGDQIWLVSTRHLPCGSAMAVALPDYDVRFYSQNQWHHATAEEFFHQDDPELTTIFYVHGNRYEQHDAIVSGWDVYHALARGLSASQKIRLVVWSWPSGQAALRPLRDARIKETRTAAEGLYLARYLAALEPDIKTNIIGYSFGARVALGAVHLTGGGELAGRVLQTMPQPGAQYQFAILAGAAEADGLLPGGLFQQTMSRTSELLNLYNPADPALKHYRALDRSYRPKAIGGIGIIGRNQLDTSKIRERNVSCIVGRSHEEERYFGSESVMSEVRALLVQ